MSKDNSGGPQGSCSSAYLLIIWEAGRAVRQQNLQGIKNSSVKVQRLLCATSETNKIV